MKKNVKQSSKLPSISIVTPSFNQGQFLEECICSVLEQNYPDLEYIIIDGKSTDNSVAVIKKYEKYLNYWVSEKDKGQTDGINKGLKRASGDIVAWLNSDDFYVPGALKHIAEIYQCSPNASFYFGDGYRVDEAGNIKSNFFPEKPISYNQELFILGMNYVLQPSAFMNAKYLKEINYLDETLKYGMDSDLWIRLAQLAEPVFIPEVISASREYEETKTSTGMFERIEELRQIAAKHSDLPMTPGTMCYFLGTLHQFCTSRKDIFPDAYRMSIEKFWFDTAELFKRWGGRMDAFPKTAPLVTGIYPDGWTAERVDIFYNIGMENSSTAALVEMTLELPPEAPTSSVLITCGEAKYILFKGKKLTIRQPLLASQQSVHFLFSPAFQWNTINLNEDIRKLACICHSCQLIVSNKTTELFRLVC